MQVGDQGQVSAGGLWEMLEGLVSWVGGAYVAGDELEGRAEFFLRVVYEPFGGIAAVVGARGKDILGSEPVADAYHKGGGTVRVGFDDRIKAATLVSNMLSALGT